MGSQDPAGVGLCVSMPAERNTTMWFKKDYTNKLGFFGHTFKVNDDFVWYQSAYANTFRVLKSDIETVSTDTVGWGKAKLKISGKGVVLAEVELPKSWAEKAQIFILKEIGKLN